MLWWVFFPLSKLCSSQFKYIFPRVRLFSVGNSALALSYSSDEDKLSGNSKSFDVSEPASGGKTLKCTDIFMHGSDKEDLNRLALIMNSCGWEFCGDPFKFSGSHVVHILNVLFRNSSDASVVLYFFRWLEDFRGSGHSICTICTMIHILVSGNMNLRAVDLIAHVSKNVEVVELFETLYGTHKDKTVLNTVCSMLVQCYAREKRIEEAWKTTHLMKQFALFPTAAVYNLFLAVSLDLERTDIAWDLFENVHENIGLNTSLFSVFIKYHCRKGSIDSAWKLLTDMRNFGISPDVVSYTMVVNSLCKASHLKEATAVLFKMVGMGIPLDVVIVSALVDGYCENGRSKEALMVMRYFKLYPNIFLYTSFISDLCKRGEMVEACHTFNNMIESGLHPDCVCYSTMISGYCDADDPSNALKYLGMMLKGGVKPSVVTYTSLINIFSKVKDMEKVEHILSVIHDEGLTLDIITYNVLMNAYTKNGQLHKAFQLLDEMRSCKTYPDNVTYNTIVDGLIRRGFMIEAKALLDEFPRRGLLPDVVTFTSIISGFAIEGKFDDAFLIWHCMSDRAVEPDIVTCSALLNGYCRQKRMEEAMCLFRRMLSVGLKPDLILFNTLIYGFCRLGDVDNALNTVSIMVEYDALPNEITLRALVLGYGHRLVADPLGVATFKLRSKLMEFGFNLDNR